MNFLDTYDVPGSVTPTSNQPEQSLNEEVSQVIGQLGRFWGGIRERSQSVFETARKDLSGVVAQPQKELGGDASGEPSSSSSEENQASTSEAENDGQAGSLSEAESSLSSSTITEQDQPSAPSPPGQTLFSRLQSALPPNIVSTVQNNLPESLKHANLDFAQLRTTLSSEFQRVQGVTRTQAEEYVHKSEVLLREAVKEAGEVLKDVVKVVPPEESFMSGSSTGLVWDGTDVWMLPSDDWGETDIKGKGKNSSSIRASGHRAVASRAESLRKRLKRDPEIVKFDPESDEVVKASYVSWVNAEVETKEGGIEGEVWKAKAADVLSEPVDGQALQATQDALVPSEMTAEIFWKRFFFRVYQIECEEHKRKALLQDSLQNEDDFKWEDDDDEAPSKQAEATTPVPSHQVPKLAKNEPAKPSAPSSRAHTPSLASPRESSEDSYDLVSTGSVSTSGDGTGGKKGDDDPDSDWE